MSFIEYKRGLKEHPTGWQGFRVSIKGIDNVYRQKYFSMTYPRTGQYLPDEEILKIKQQAHLLHQKWRHETSILRDMHHQNFSIRIKKESTNKPTIQIVMYKTIDKKPVILQTTVNGCRKTFHDAWDCILQKYIHRFNPPLIKIKRMQSNKPTFDDVNKKRIEFNRTNVEQFTERQLKICFDIHE